MRTPSCPTPATILLTLCLGGAMLGCSTETTTPDAGPADAGSTDAGDTDAGAPDAGDDTVPIAADALHDELVKVLCLAFKRCEVPGNDLVFADQSGCEAAVTQYLSQGVTFNGLPQLKAAIASGDVTIDGRAARHCVDALATTSACALMLSSDHFAFNLEPACAGVFTGRLAKDAECVLDEACAGASHCARTDLNACSGKCAPRGEGPCEAADACLPGQYCGSVENFIGTCSTSAEGTRCRSNTDCPDGLECQEGRRGSTCLKKPRAGEACTGNCAAGLYCPAIDAPKCLPLPTIGESCFDTRRECGAGAACVSNIPPGTCMALPPAGEPCADGACADGLTCDQSGATPTCRSSLAQLGEACTIGTCAPGLDCASSDSKCHALPGLGEECSHLRCAAGLRCVVSATGPVCGAIGQEGDLCFEHEQCATGLWCPSETCVPQLAENAECDGPGSRQCGPGLECDPRSGQWRCKPISTGQACVNDRCGPSAYCVPVTPTPSMVTCQAPPTVGQPCASGRCAAGLDCRPEEGGNVCRALGQSGETCNQSWPQACVDGLSCFSLTGPEGLCLGRKRAGEACTNTFECGGSLSSSYCLEGKCAPRPKAGSPCVKGTLGESTLDLCDTYSSWCDLSGDVPTCKPFLAIGDPCSRGDESCGDRGGLGYCRSGTCVAYDVAECGGDEEG